MSLTSAPVTPCSCPDGWKPEGWAYCAECYEGQIERLRAALEPFAKIANFCHPRHRDSRPFIFGFDTAIAQRLTIGDLRSAAAALSSSDRAKNNEQERQ